MKKQLVLFILVLSIFLCGCTQYKDSSIQDSDGAITLWVLTEETPSHGMNQQAETLIRQFQSEHENVIVKLDILPTNEEERATYLEKIRTPIMAGEGPDVYLMPVSNVLTLDQPVRYTYVRVEPLFSDVMLAMHNGLFADISEYYDSDLELEKDALVPEIMESGVIGDARYVLPLRYDYPVVYALPNELEQYGFSMDILESGFDEALDQALAINDQELLFGLEYVGSNIFSDWIDYENGEVSLTGEELADYLTKFQQLKQITGLDTWLRYKYNIPTYTLHGGLADDLLPMYISSLSSAIEYAAIAKAENMELTMLPLRSNDGELIANVTYYAAVGSGCENPELAYDLIRRFMLEESQWEMNRKGLARLEDYYGLVEEGWPVRARGSTTALWSSLQQQIENKRANGRTLLNTELCDSDIPLLDEKIDQVRFRTALDELLDDMAYSLNDFENGNAPNDVDIDTLAEEIIQELQWHVAEG